MRWTNYSILSLLGATLALGGCSCGEDPPAKVTTCADLTCLDHQLCQEASGATPATCAPACEAGFAWNGSACEASATATCAPSPAAGSIAMRCELEHRTCDETTAGMATCTTCLDGYVEVGGACEARVTCTELMCSSQNRACEPQPNARCTTCLDGFIEDGVACRAPRTCADTECPSGQTCIEGAAGMDATCVAGSCPEGQVPRASGGGCVRCTVSCEGRAGGTGRVYPDVATLADTCICESQPGWFWDDGAFGGGDLRPCDEDGDGWVRVTARRAIERTADVAIRNNARCSLREIDRVLLENDDGVSREVALQATLELYEPERLDDPELLQDALDQGTLPAFPGRPLRADELNTLTKACVWKSDAQQQADFNQNGLEDVDEGHRDPRLADPTNPLVPLYDFSYFIEINRGWFEPAARAGDPGRYVISEKRRSATEPDEGRKLQLAPAPEDGGDHWRTCERQRDAAFEPAAPGFDFAEHDAPSWSGMGHHSQFRCLRIVTTASGAPHEATPDELTTAWTLNACTASGVSPPVAGAVAENPRDPVLTCTVPTTPDPRTTATAPVMLAVSKYVPYDDAFNTFGQPTYVRGCVNACAEHPDFCPGWSPDPLTNTAQCVGRTRDFGALYCGCGRGFAGPSCELACPGDLEAPASDGVGHLFTADLELAPRSGVWMCGSVTAGGGELTSDPQTSTTTWTLRGEIPAASTIPTDDLCAAAAADAGVGGGDAGCTWRVRSGAP
ncbi:hypothetical protein L6R52_23390 [Myxococcota bacterium]|nr:hypothetical protein [Myxococcota bacterium]